MDDFAIEFRSINPANSLEVKTAEKHANLKRHFSVHDYIEKAKEIENVTQFHTYVRKVMYDFGYTIFGCGVALENNHPTPILDFFCSGDTEWIQYYRKSLISNDPFIPYCVKHTTPLIWMAKTDSSELSKTAPNFTYATNCFGINSFVTLPQKGPQCLASGFRFGCQDNEKLNRADIEASLPMLSLLSCYMYEAFAHIIRPNQTYQPIKLTKRESEILSWVAHGKDSWSISHILNISENTVHFHLKNIHKKMHVNSRQHAVAKAIKLNLINY